MKDMGWGDGYKYNPDHDDGAPEQRYMPQELEGRIFYAPNPRGVVQTKLVVGESSSSDSSRGFFGGNCASNGGKMAPGTLDTCPDSESMDGEQVCGSPSF